MSEFFNDLFIFEMANSHQGSVEHGISIINEMGRIAKKYNIKAAVKLQYRNLDTFIHPNYVGRTDIKHIPRFESTKMSYDNFCRLVEVIHQNDMISMSTPFDEVGVEWCLDQDIDVIKVASCSCMDWPLLEKVAKAKKPVIISTGGKVVSEIDKIYNFFTHRNVDFALMHCIAEYPAPESHIQLDFLEKMQKRYRGIMIGYSGHENPDDNIIPMMAIAKGASIMERHVGLPTESITLNSYSMNPGQAEKWVEAILRAKNICVLKNYGEKYVSPAEVESLLSLSRGVFVKNAVKMGDKIYKENVFFAMPAAEGQLLSGSYDDGMIATRDYAKNAAVYETRVVTKINIARSVIHDAKGLLLEAGIALGDDFEVELSHHYGIEHFRNTGAIIISIINREYCKKLIVVLSGQQHPTHLHKVKEETFQLLYGDLECVIEGKQINMKPGDIQTILRGERHSFASKGGAVFEEVSTTHVKGDSYYDDKNIASKDLMDRKTIVKEW